jgi:hypothetical protein
LAKSYSMADLWKGDQMEIWERQESGGAGDIVLRRVMRWSIRRRRVRGLTDEGTDRGGMFMVTEE